MTRDDSNNGLHAASWGSTVDRVRTPPGLGLALVAGLFVVLGEGGARTQSTARVWCPRRRRAAFCPRLR